MSNEKARSNKERVNCLEELKLRENVINTGYTQIAPLCQCVISCDMPDFYLIITVIIKTFAVPISGILFTIYCTHTEHPFNTLQCISLVF